MSQEELIFARQDADMQRDRANSAETKVQELSGLLKEKEAENQYLGIRNATLEEENIALREEIIALREENRILKEQLKPNLDQIKSKEVRRIVLKRTD